MLPKLLIIPEHLDSGITEPNSCNSPISSGLGAQGLLPLPSFGSTDLQWLEPLKSFVHARRSKSEGWSGVVPESVSSAVVPDSNSSAHSINISEHSHSPREPVQSWQIKDLERELHFVKLENQETQHLYAKATRRVRVLETEKQDLCRKLELEENMTIFLKKKIAVMTDNARFTNEDLTERMEEAVRQAEWYKTSWEDLKFSKEIDLSAESDKRISQMKNVIANLKEENQRSIKRKIESENSLKELRDKLILKDSELKKKSRDVRQVSLRLLKANDTFNFFQEEKKADEDKMMQLESEILQKNAKCDEQSDLINCLQQKLREQSMTGVERTSPTEQISHFTSLEDDVEETFVHPISLSISSFSVDNKINAPSHSRRSSPMVWDRFYSPPKPPSENALQEEYTFAFPNLGPVASDEKPILPRQSFDIPFSSQRFNQSSDPSRKKSNYSVINFLWSYQTFAWSSSLLCILAAIYCLSSSKHKSQVGFSKTSSEKDASSAVSVNLLVKKPEKVSSNSERTMG